MPDAFRPVILLIGANPGQRLEHVQQELNNIEDMIRMKFGQGIECQLKKTSSLDEVYRYVSMNRRQIIALHFAGHADQSKESLLLEGHSVAGKNLAELICKGEAPNLKLAFLNACHTHSLLPALSEAGIPNIIATSAGVDDEAAAEFALFFYRELLINGLPFQKAFRSANNYLDNKGGCPLPVYRAPVSTDANEAWGLYTSGEHTDFKLAGLVEESRQGISDSAVNYPLKCDLFICRINRDNQDEKLVEYLESHNSARHTAALPLVIYGEDFHLPDLYATKLGAYLSPGKPGKPLRLEDSLAEVALEIKYAFPKSHSGQDAFAREIAADIYKRMGGASELDYSKESLEGLPLIELLSKFKREILVLRSNVEPFSDSRILDFHHRFWRNIHVPGKNLISILVVGQRVKRRTAWLPWLGQASFGKAKSIIEKWRPQDMGRYCLPQLDYIHSKDDLDNWERKNKRNRDWNEFFNRIGHDSKYLEIRNTSQKMTLFEVKKIISAAASVARSA